MTYLYHDELDHSNSFRIRASYFYGYVIRTSSTPALYWSPGWQDKGWLEGVQFGLRML